MKLPGRNRRREDSGAPGDVTPDTTTATEAGATDSTPADDTAGVTAAAAKPADTKPADTKAADTKAADTKAAAKTAGSRSTGGVAAVGGVRNRVRRFLQKPGSADLSRYSKLLPQIAAQEDRLRELTGEELTDAAGDAVEDADLCAIAREAARRALGERPFDVQLIGTLAMLSGQIAEMATGEGKTLAGAIAAAGYALAGRSVHVVAVNDYLARRDAEWMRPLYDLLGVSVGWINQSSTPEERRAAYAAEVTYAPVSEIGFDVLRDRLAVRVEDMVGATAEVALIDEADSVLIDEARVPLVLAGSAEEGIADREMADVVRKLARGAHYELDEDARN